MRRQAAHSSESPNTNFGIRTDHESHRLAKKLSPESLAANSWCAPLAAISVPAQGMRKYGKLTAPTSARSSTAKTCSVIE
jgi:hypothetical protein